MIRVRWNTDGDNVTTRWYSGRDSEHLAFNGVLTFEQDHWAELQDQLVTLPRWVQLEIERDPSIVIVPAGRGSSYS